MSDLPRISRWPEAALIYTCCHGVIINSAPFTLKNVLVWVITYKVTTVLPQLF